LWHIHEPAILYNLEQRSWEDEPYTFMGPVLVAVNPLKRIPDPKGVIGTSKATLHAHPFAVAETSYQQLKFANMQAKNDAASSLKAAKVSKKDKGGKKAKAAQAGDVQPVNQSVVVGGESGAGKTESSKVSL
jgi:myosin heavy subunit